MTAEALATWLDDKATYYSDPGVAEKHRRAAALLRAGERCAEYSRMENHYRYNPYDFGMKYGIVTPTGSDHPRVFNELCERFLSIKRIKVIAAYSALTPEAGKE